MTQHHSGNVAPPLAAGPTGARPRDVAEPIDAIDQLSDGYFEMDAEYRYRRVNPAGARLSQKTPDDLLGKHVLEVFPEVATSEVHRAVQRVMASREAEHVETYYAPLRLWAVNSIYPFRDGVAIVSRDITAQKLLEQNLAFLADASKLLSASLDFKRTMRNVARPAVPHIADWCAVDMLTGLRTVELLAVAHVDPEKVHWAEELRRRDPVELDRPTGLPRVLRTGRPEFYPVITDELLVATAKDEQALALARSIGFSSAMIVPLPGREHTIGAITFVTAESGRHYTAADLHMAEELASRAALAIENSRLYSESQRAVAVRDDFIAAASHELKTPVTSLKLYNQMLERLAARRGDGRTGRYLGRMNAQIDRLTLLINDLLDVSRIEAGTLELRREEVELRSLVHEVVDAVQVTADRHRIDVMGEVSRPVSGDRERLGQVVTNLLANAVKYSPGAERVAVRLAESEEGAVIEVEDFGIGIDAEHLDRVFDRFFRVSSDDEKTFPGLGMGLFISQEIVRRHGGTLRVTSKKGSGSVFRVVIPFGEQPGEAGRPETAA